MALSKILPASQEVQAIGKNLIINGAMQVSQRGTSVSGTTTSGYKTVDRWDSNASGTTFNQSQESVTVGGETGLPVQFTKYLKHDVTTGNDNAAIYQYVEDVASVPSGSVTVSFYAKGTTPDGGLKVRFFQNFGSGGSGEVELTSEIQSFTLTSTWQRFTATITVPSISGKTIGTGSKFIVGFGQGSSTSTNAWELDITGIQLEVGETATPFEHRSYGDELSKCQRYYWKTTDGELSIHMQRSYNNYNAYYGAMYFPTTMRAAPTFTTENSNITKPSIVDQTATFNAYQMSLSMANIYCNPSTDSGAYTYTAVAKNNSMRFDAEL